MLAVHGKSSEFRAILWLISARLDHIRIGKLSGSSPCEESGRERIVAIESYVEGL
jgi:hypothetical protein